MNISTPSALERLLIEVWRDVLGRDAADAHTDFFESGGGGPEVRRLLKRVRETLHVAVSARTVREASTVTAFAEALKRQVDHPGRLERLAERLLQDRRRATAREGASAGASW